VRKSRLTPEALRTALILTCGNVTAAAAILDPPMSKMQIMRLTEKYDLRDFALRLRLLAGQSATGRPANVRSLN
jgi:hypothetical protein